MKSKLFEIIYNLTHKEPWEERALMTIVNGNPTLPKGMRIDIIVEEKTAKEEPHFHLFPANHIPKKGRANNYDLITRVAITEIPPSKPSEIHAITENKLVPSEFQEAIFIWSKENVKNSKINNWKLAEKFWEAQANAFR